MIMNDSAEVFFFYRQSKWHWRGDKQLSICITFMANSAPNNLNCRSSAAFF